jgi:hypothetical protein
MEGGGGVSTDLMTKTFDPDQFVAEALLSADNRMQRAKGRDVDTYALAYRIYPQADGAPLLRIASHAERESIAGLAVAQ